MSRRDKEGYDEWVELESRKLAAHESRFPDLPLEKNLPVSGRYGKTLPVVLAQAEKKYGHMTIAELVEHRMRNGHGVASRY